MIRQQLSVKRHTKAIASGDTEAFALFYKTWFGQMYKEAQHITGRDESFCMDVVQDAMIKVIKSLRRPINTEKQLWSWLRVIIKCCAYDKLRSENKRQKREQNIASRNHNKLTNSSDAETTAHSDITEQLIWLRKELAHVDTLSHQLLVLRYRLGWTLQNISQYTGLSPGAVDGRISRIIRSLHSKAESKGVRKIP